MYQLEWADEKNWTQCPVDTAWSSAVDSSRLTRIMDLTWEEHCVECAIPECYGNCVLYRRRADGACARFVYGIVPDHRFRGRYDFGADITFRKWGKLEAYLGHASIPGTAADSSLPLDAFIIECYSPSSDSFNLFCEYFTEVQRVRNTRYRQSFTVRPGENLFITPFADMKIDALEGYLYLYPEKSGIDHRLIFTWLDFVQYEYAGHEQQPPEVKPAYPAGKVKCVAWDLDNTLWNGTFLEQDAVELNPAAADLVTRLDEKGILQTILSKNDFEPCWDQLKKMGMEKYFLEPAINWNRKSNNIREIADKLNIGLDSIAVIDDSPFEREEIAGAWPQVRVYSEKEIDRLLCYEEFDVITSRESSGRRETYRMESQRRQERRTFSGSYDEFIAACRMKAVAFVPLEVDEIERCYELVQRSNQLNLSTVRYSREQFGALLADRETLSLGLRCRDRFGDYGIVGFASIRFSAEAPVMENFVLSCRIAQKRVEHHFFKAVTGLLAERNYPELRVRFIRTEKNGPLREVFSELPFRPVAGDDPDELALATDALADSHDLLHFVLTI